jgi:hypothetical protein
MEVQAAKSINRSFTDRGLDWAASSPVAPLEKDEMKDAKLRDTFVMLSDWRGRIVWESG